MPHSTMWLNSATHDFHSPVLPSVGVYFGIIWHCNDRTVEKWWTVPFDVISYTQIITTMRFHNACSCFSWCQCPAQLTTHKWRDIPQDDCWLTWISWRLAAFSTSLLWCHYQVGCRHKAEHDLLVLCTRENQSSHILLIPRLLPLWWMWAL